MIENVKPVKIFAGPCQTSSIEQVKFQIELATMRATNPNGTSVKVISGERFCTDKSRTKREKIGAGIDHTEIMDFRLQLMDAIMHSTKMPEIPVTQGVKWAEQIQSAVPDMVLGMETMDWIHGIIFSGHIQPGLGLLWLPSVMQLGTPASMIAKVAAENDWAFGMKNGKWTEKKLPRHNDDVKVTNIEATAIGILGSYALEVFDSSKRLKDIIYFERGKVTPEKGKYRNFPDDQGTRIIKKELTKILLEIPEEVRPKLIIAKDQSHINGPDKREDIVDEVVEAATETKDLNGDYLYDMVILESTFPGDEPLSDAGQHITGEELQEVVNRIAKKRPIFDRKDNLKIL